MSGIRLTDGLMFVSWQLDWKGFGESEAGSILEAVAGQDKTVQGRAKSGGVPVVHWWPRGGFPISFSSETLLQLYRREGVPTTKTQ